MNNSGKISSHITAVLTLLIFFLPSLQAGSHRCDWSVFAYGGSWTDTRIGQIFQFKTDMQNSHVWVGGLSRHITDITDDLLLEGEINTGIHSGRYQDHWEFNWSFNLRWTRFPWDHVLDTSLLYGLGLSYASRRPEIEQRSDRGPTHVLVFMPVEFTFSLPENSFSQCSRYEILLRVHHRSGAYGFVSDARGSNFLTGGLRYRF